MGGQTWPLAFYDTIGVLVPGALFPLVIGLVAREALQLYGSSGWLIALTAFALGHLVQALSKLVSKGLNGIVRAKSYFDEAPSWLKNELHDGLKQYYGKRFDEATEAQIKDLCFSAAWNRLENYRTFTAISDMSRALTAMLLIAAAELVLVGSGVTPAGIRLNPWPWAGLFGVLAVIFEYRSRSFRKLADGVVFSSFLAVVSSERK